MHAHGPRQVSSQLKTTLYGQEVASLSERTRSPRLLAIVPVLTAVVAIACTAGSQPPVEPPAKLFSDLVDCTGKGLAELEGSYLVDWVPANLDAETSRIVLTNATAWARDNCYVPCEFQMCGMILGGPDEQVTVYIRPQDVEFGDGGIWPEATIVLSRENWEIVDSTMFHTGCVMWTGKCTPTSEA